MVTEIHILGDFQINCSCIEFSNFFFQVQKANTFLVDALKTFENEGWSLLKVQTLTDTAKCYENLNDWEKLLRTCAQIACANQLVTSDQKLQYCQKFRDIASQHIGTIILIIPQCFETTEKVSFNIASEASYVCILSGKSSLKMPKIVNLVKKIWKMPKLENKTFWVIFKHCE